MDRGRVMGEEGRGLVFLDVYCAFGVDFNFCNSFVREMVVEV